MSADHEHATGDGELFKFKQQFIGAGHVALSEQRLTADDTSGLIMRAVANLMMRRADEALKDLANPLIGNQHDAQIWRAMAYTQQGKWAEAREAFLGLDSSIGTLPLELQRIVLRVAVRTSIEAGDYGAAANELNEFDQIGIPADVMPRQVVQPWLSIVPIAESRSSYNGLIILAFMIVSGSLTAFAIHRFATRATRRSAIWDCGFPLYAP